MTDPTPSDRLRRADESKDCPRCTRASKAFGKPHCASPNCTWCVCPCRTTFELYGSGSYHPDDYPKGT